MKKTLLSLGLLLFGVGQAFSQNYFMVNKTGTTSEYVFTNTAASVLLTSASGTLNDVLSSSVTLPFSFNFYGQAETSFKASDNGYITFDHAATTSDPNQTTLPDTASAPKNAIFAFWQDLQMLTDGNFPAQISTWTYGTAPNRVCVVQWSVMSPKGTTGDYAYFAIRMYEAGYFDVVHNYGHGNYSATVGCQNSTGTVGLSSANFGFNWSSGNYDQTQSPVFEFHYASLPIDIVLTNPGISAGNTMYRRTLPTFVKGDNVNFGGQINNFGSKKITTYTLNYTVDGGTPVTKVVKTSLAAMGGYEALSVPSWVAANAGQFHNIHLWISSVNDTALTDTSHYSANYNVFVINGGTNNVVKKTLVEEGTGAWCGYCPHAHLALRDFEANDPNVVEISNHNSDAMAITNGNAINNVYSPNSYPFITIDRHLFDGEAVVAPAISTVDYASTWAPLESQESSIGSVPVSMGILQKTYDPASRKIELTLTGQFYDYVGGDIRVTVALCENRVRGPHSDPDTAGTGAWSQHNYYSSKWASVGGTSDSLYNEPARINGYFHDHVSRAYFTSNAFGDPLITAGDNVIATPGQTFSKTYNMTVPLYSTNPTAKVAYAASSLYTDDQPNYSDEYYSSVAGDAYNKWQDMYLVAYVSMYNPNDPTFCEVLNAYQVPLVGWSAGIDPASKQINDIDLYPNPTTGNTVLNYSLTHASNVTIDVYDMMGHKVAQVQNGTQMAGNQSVTINAASYTNGLYFATITSNGVQAVKKFMVQK